MVARQIQSISKGEACRRQLETAIDLYFAEGDEVSIHTLVCAARDIANVLAGDKPRGLNLAKEILVGVVPDKHDVVFDKLAEAYNFFKHASRDPTATVFFNQSSTELLLLDACSAFEAAIGPLPRLGLFRMWTRMVMPPGVFPLSEQQLVLQAIADVDPLTRQAFYAKFLPIALEVDGGAAEAIRQAERAVAPNPRPFKARTRKPKGQSTGGN